MLTGCLSPHRVVVTSTPVRGWEQGVQVAFENEDTLALRDLHIVVRYNDRFVGDTLRLAVRTTAPDSLVFQEPFTLVIPRGHHPAALGDEATILYRRNVVFDKAGRYRVSFTPVVPVDGVEAIGIRY